MKESSAACASGEALTSRQRVCVRVRAPADTLWPFKTVNTTFLQSALTRRAAFMSESPSCSPGSKVAPLCFKGRCQL